MWGFLKVIDRAESEYNGTVQVVSAIDGIRIVAGGVSQSGQLVQIVWSAALKRILKEQRDIKNILILGLGGGSSAKLVNKYWPSAKITGVDIDPIMIDFGRRYLELDKINNLEIVEADAVEFVIKNKKTYDLILMDVYTGDVIPEVFVNLKFLTKMKLLLAPKGLAAFNHLYSDKEKTEGDELKKKLRELFPVIISVKPEANIVFVCFTK